MPQGHQGGITLILIASSNKDIASLNIAKQILNSYPFPETTEIFQENPIYEANITNRRVKLVTLNEESIRAQNLPALFNDLELIVFISKHSSESGTPTLSVHTPGNLGDAELGGVPRRVSISPANAMRDALKALMRLRDAMKLGYEVSYEGTHHGPSLDVPTMFVELGSSPKQWSDLSGAVAVAQATMEAVSEFDNRTSRVVIGIGGTHYNAKFTRITMENDVAFSHMIPKYAIPDLDVEMLSQCVDRTLEEVEYAILDWKGIKSENKPSLVRMLNDIGLMFEKI